MYLVFDTGGTKMRMAFSPDGKTLEPPKIFPTPREFGEGMQKVAQTVAEVVRGRPLKAMAGGMPGPMNEDNSIVLNAPNMPGWNNQPLKKELERITGAPVYLENDTTMVGLGEVMKGAGRGYDIVSYITVSTGIGGKRFVKGKLEESAFGFEPGHMIIDVDGFVCNCGLAGHLEGLASGNGVKRRFGQAPETIKDAAVWQDVTRYLAAGLINVSVMWSPHCIVLGGSVMQRISLENLRAAMEKFGIVFKRLPELKLAQLGDLGGLEGALTFLHQRL